MPFIDIKTLFPNSTMEILHVTENNAIILTNTSIIILSNRGVCIVRLRHKDKTARCRFFVVPGDNPALLGMFDIKLLGIPMIICEG